MSFFIIIRSVYHVMYVNQDNIKQECPNIQKCAWHIFINKKEVKRYSPASSWFQVRIWTEFDNITFVIIFSSLNFIDITLDNVQTINNLLLSEK